VIDAPAKTYVEAILASYRRLSDVVTRPRPQDRQLAVTLYQRGVPLSLVETALALATARRRARPADAMPLSPVRSLHYFLPVIEELLAQPPGDGYLEYLREHLGHATAGDRPENDVSR
jgi:hypothetical protein